jgi:hypothetical protein
VILNPGLEIIHSTDFSTSLMARNIAMSDLLARKSLTRDGNNTYLVINMMNELVKEQYSWTS